MTYRIDDLIEEVRYNTERYARANLGGNLNTQGIVKELKAERNRLDKAIAALDGEDETRVTMTTDEPAGNGTPTLRKRRRMSAATRKRLSVVMKQRWAARRKKN